ncbi:MAG: hypothetical protein U0903_15620 [Planctomycetales bacterium]
MPAGERRANYPPQRRADDCESSDWHTCLATRRLRNWWRQKWNIKSLDLQLIAARSLTHPQVNFVSSYQVNGFGDKLLAYNDTTTAQH